MTSLTRGESVQSRRSWIPRGRQWLECLVLAVVYFCTARLGQLFAIEPGNVTPVWLPSGIILALLVIRGPWLWPGVWLGAFIGNAWAYLGLSDVSLLCRAVIAGTSNGVGDVLCGLIGYWAITRDGEVSLPHQRLRAVWRFAVYAAFLGSLVSALFGAGAMTLTGFIPADAAVTVGVTWLAGDAVGVLLLGSTILSFWDGWSRGSLLPGRVSEQAVFWVLLIGVTAIDALEVALPGGVHFPRSALLLVLVWSTLRFRPTVSYLASVMVSTVGISLLFLGGAGSEHAQNVELIEQQMFIAVIFLTNMVLMATVNEYRTTASALSEARDVAERTSEFKTRFLATMSHEIRTPLNGVTGMSELLMETDLDPNQLGYARSIHACSQHLVTLTNDVLDLSKLEAGQLALDPSECQLHDFAYGVGLMFRPSAAAKGLDLNVEVAADVPTVVTADSVRLRQVLANLLSNAVKYTVEGSVELRVSRDGANVQFEVADTGTGISATELERIFDEFQQAEHTRVEHGGTGLGLFLSRALTKLMHGELTASSKVGEGSTFRLSVPLQSAATPAVDGPEQEESECALGGRVLVADDNAVNRRVADALLRRLGCEVTLVEDGTEAVQRMVAESFDLVLMDCHMPNMDGYEATTRIRALPEGRGEVPIVALTASADPVEHERCLEVGMNHILTKPVNRVTLSKGLYPWIGLRDLQ